MAGHADFRRREPRYRRRFHRSMAVAAIEAVVTDVMLVTEGDGLIFSDSYIGDIGAAVHPVCEGDDESGDEATNDDADLRDGIGTSMKDLRHFQTGSKVLW